MNTVAIFETDVFGITLLFLFQIAPVEQIGSTSKIIHSLYIHMYILFYTHYYTCTPICIYVCVCVCECECVYVHQYCEFDVGVSLDMERACAQ